MALPKIEDPRISLLVSVYAEAARNISILLDTMLLEDPARRVVILNQLLDILQELGAKTDKWSARFIQDFVNEADVIARGDIRSAAPEIALGATINQSAVNSLITSLNGNLAKARSSVELLANKIFRVTSLSNEFPELDILVRQQVAVGMAEAEVTALIQQRIATTLRTQFRDELVTVVGKNGRRFTFALDYYAGMVAVNTRAQAQTVATLFRANEGQHDLVRVTPNPSVGGDYCDAYRGRVFSISGASTIYPPLSLTPNGGPPFHPWCKHGLGIFIPELHSIAEQKEFAKVDEKFLLKGNEDSPNRLIRDWWSVKSRNSNPAPLRFI